jgi:hypothetical protein
MVCAAALLVSGCGSDKEGKDLPKSSVAQLQTSLDSIQRRFEEGDGACNDITEGDDTDVSAVQHKIDALPADVDKDVKDALQESFNNLFDLVEQQCNKTDTTTETTPTVTETTPTVTQTTPTETTPTETTPTETNTTPQNNGNGNGNGGTGNGNGNGNGGGKGGNSGGKQAPPGGD